MKQDKETRNRLLQSAKEEFMEKGYMKASLRNICRNAGLTTGALYFFFHDKADLYEALTKDTLNAIYNIMQEHFKAEKKLAEKGLLMEPAAEGEKDEFGDDFEVTKMIIHQMYLRRDEVLLVLTKSQGSHLENIEDKFIEMAEEHCRTIMLQMQRLNPKVVPDEHFLHWVSHMVVGAFVYMITHIENEAEAIKFMSHEVTYMQSGWLGLFMNKD